MKTAIVNMIEKLGSRVSFVDLLKLPGFKGDEAIGHSDLNIAYWVGVSDEAIDAIHYLVAEEVVEMTPTDIMPYLIDGNTLDVPLAEDAVRYDALRWAPVVINKGANFYHYLACEEAGVLQ